MKKIFYILVFLISALLSHAQVYTFYADSTAFLRRGLLAPGNELIIENSTRDKQYGFLQNMWNGRTRFAYAVDTAIALNDSTVRYFRGLNYFDITIHGRGSSGGGATDTTQLARNYIYLFGVGGQSNMSGEQGPVPNPVSGSPSVDGWFAKKYKDAEGITIGNDPTGMGTGATPFPSFELTYYKMTGRKVLIVNRAKSGTAQSAIADAGNGNWQVSGGSLDDTLIATMKRAKTAAEAAGYTVVYGGILWGQGELDGRKINDGVITQAQYQQALKDMIAEYRSNFSNIPFYIIRTGTNTNESDNGFDQVRKAQQYVSNYDSLTKIVAWEAADFPNTGKMKDTVHYNNAGNNVLGRAAAENIVAATGNIFQSRNDPNASYKPIYFLNGNVSINSYPKYQLDTALYVNGKVKIGAYTLPSTDGASGYVLQTNGLGSVSWQPGGSGGGGISGGAANKVTYWTSPTTVSYNNNFSWDNTNTRLGIGNASPNYTLDVTGQSFLNYTFNTTTTAAQNRTLQVIANATSSSNSTDYFPRAGFFQMNTAGATDFANPANGNVAGIHGMANMNTNVTVAEGIGFLGEGRISAASTTTTLTGAEGMINALSGTGNVTDATGVLAAAWSSGGAMNATNIYYFRSKDIAGAGILGATNKYGLYVHPISGGTTINDAIKTNGGLVDFTNTTTQLRLSYDATHYAQFTTDVGGNLTIIPSPGQFRIGYDATHYGALVPDASGNLAITSSTGNVNVNKLGVNIIPSSFTFEANGTSKFDDNMTLASLKYFQTDGGSASTIRFGANSLLDGLFTVFATGSSAKNIQIGAGAWNFAGAYNMQGWQNAATMGSDLTAGNTVMWKITNNTGDMYFLGKGSVGTSAQNNTFTVNGSFATAYISKSASYTAAISDHTIEVTATGQTITLPTAAGITGREYTIKLTASGSGTVNTTSSQTIDGSTTYSLSAQYKYVTVQSNGSNWIIIANN